MNVKFSVFQFLFFGFLFIYVGTSSAQNDTAGKTDPYQRNMEAVQINKAPVIDGKLDDPVWQTVEFQNNFFQREPKEGEPATEKTEVAIIYDKKNLYIGARCFDSEPEKIIATEMRRDAFLYKDDYFSIIFDTFHDFRNAFYFTTNPFGLRRDGTVSDEGKIQNSNWDGVWSCKTSIDNRGWFVEMAIPWQTLRFKEGGKTVWGANFVRRIQRKNEDDYWRLIPRDAGWFGRFRMSEAGKIYGFENLKMGGTFELKPFVTGGMQHDLFTDYKTDRTGDAGMDMKINLSSTLTADLTYNTDFAQVEADQERINLTRFSLFFPEKRDFFLEGAETFTFGQTGGHSFRPDAGAIQLFYSRRIGLESGRFVPIIGGGRLNGKVGKYTLGVLSLQTEKTSIDGDDPTIVPNTNFSVFRLKRNLFSRSSAGIMLLNKRQSDGSYNRSFGFDSNFPVSNRFTLFLNSAGTLSSGETNHNNFAGNTGFNYESDLWKFSANLLDIQKDFNPEMGFIRRTDIRRTQAKASYSPRPSFSKAIRQFEFGLNGEYQTNHQNFMLNRRINGEFSIRFENSSRLGINLTSEYDYLDYNWEVRDGFIIPIRGYTNNEVRIRYNTNRSHAVSVRMNLNVGEYYTGNRVGGTISTDILAFKRLTANIMFNYNKVSLPEGHFNTVATSARIIYSFNPDFYIKAYLQYYDDKLLLGGKARYSENIILRYHYRPGSDFYLVLNQENLFGHGEDILNNRTIMAKMTFFLRK